ncbi:transcriptional regulatory protein moc3 [Pleurostoma richardsiae]|uniref:Transcriptional regulatory protein moc3 n=1 Tax=Pleurostoma richardsiae TaxID=41990 RepID=A0AA38R705_9PEZI|nr:transcriptional regulatory protein moc3 [Pleurostoma richardsiae]
MVGVPGRSKGCNTCRRRRVKCDEGKPTCVRCLRAGFECLGYDRNTIWRHTSTAPFKAAGTGGLTFSASSSSSSSSPSTPAPRLNPPPLVRTAPEAAGPRHYFPELQPAYRPRFASPPRGSPPPELDLSAFRDDVCLAHMFANPVWRLYGGAWLPDAARGRLGGLALEAARAVARAGFGRMSGRREVEVAGQAAYGRCLGILAGELAERKGCAHVERAGVGERRMGKGMRKGKEDLVVPVLVMMMHASILADQGATASHMHGLARLLHACGPEAFQRQPLLDAFESARATLIIESLIARRRLFLEGAQWRSIPWALDANGKSHQSELLDIFVTVPGMLEDLSLLKDGVHTTTAFSQASPASASSNFSDTTTYASPVDTSLLSDALLPRITAELESLYRWRWRWQALHGHEVVVDTARSPRPTNGPAERLLGPIGSSRRSGVLRFVRPAAAAEIALYNAVLMWLLALLWRVKTLGAGEVIEICARRAAGTGGRSSRTAAEQAAVLPQQASFEPLRRPGAAVSVRDPAVEICAVFGWQARHHGHASSGEEEPTYMYLFPVGMAVSVLDCDAVGEEADREWARELMKVYPVTSGSTKEGGSSPGSRFGDTGEKLSLRHFANPPAAFLERRMVIVGAD